MLSVLFCSRVKDNPASNLKELLDSAVRCLLPEERDQIEFLIKYDDDDDRRPPDDFFAQYPFAIRTFAWSRGEGRHGLHHAQEYLFAQRDPRSRFCLMTADDFHFTRPGFVSEILSVPDEFCIMGPNRPSIESYAGVYEEEEQVRKWAVAFGEWSPVVSARLIEVCQNFGWQSNVDGWLMGLSVVLYDLYGIVLWRTHEPFYAREGGYGLGDTPTYNNLELTGRQGPANKYWFELLRRQARNVYLNIQHGTAFEKTAWTWSARRLWRKVRAQPARRLPLRVYYKLWRMAGAAVAPSPPRRTLGGAPDGPWAEGIPPEFYPPDAALLTELARKAERPGMAVVEVGSWVGNGSTRVLADAVRGAGGTVYCVDTWEGSGNVPHHREARRGRASMFGVFAENVRGYDGRAVVKPLAMPSVEASRLFPDASLDLVFIDGDHAYSQVKQDIRAWLPKVRPGGVLCGHDCDARYDDLCAELRAEIGQCEEQDVFHNARWPGPPEFHAGVVRAVHECLGGRATVWVPKRPTTLWSFRKPAGLLGRVRVAFAAPSGPLRRDAAAARRLEEALAPWPD